MSETVSKIGATVVVGGGYYGYGPDLDAAKKNFTRMGGKLAGGYGVFELSPRTEFTSVNMWGQVEFRSIDGKTPDQPTFTEFKPRKRAVRK